MDSLVDRCLKAIMKNDAEEFELLLHRIKQLVMKARKLPITDVKWIEDIPLFCTLYNNPRFIKTAQERLKQSYTFKPCSGLGRDVCVIDLAKALNFKKCTENLLNVYGIGRTERENKATVSDFNIFAGILNAGRLYRIEPDTVIQSLNRLVENGLDICARGPGGRTILHEAVLKMCNYKIYKTIFLLGYDVNCTDDFGVSAFLLFIWKVYHYKSRYEEIVKILKLFLYENPDMSLNAGIIEKAISYDRLRFPDVVDVSDDDVDDVSDDDTSRQDYAHNCTNKHVHQKEHLRLLPWLYKGGFQISQRDRDTIELPSLFSPCVTYNLCLKHPRSLKDIARVVIRATYPGRKLHKCINSVILPTSIQDFILMKEFDVEC